MAIGKLIKGSSAGGLSSYLLGERDNNGDIRERADVIGGTFSGRSSKALTDEFKSFEDLRRSLGKNVAHMSISFSDDDRDLTDEEQAQIGRKWAEGMGFDGYAIVSHGDHIHIAASRIKLDGSVVDDSHDYRRSEQLIRDIEKEFGLVEVEASHLLEPEREVTHRRAPSMAEISLSEKGEAPLKTQIQDMLDELLEEPITATEFTDRLESLGVDVRPNVASTGRLNGFSFSIGESSFTGAQLGGKYKLKNMEKQGFEYEPNRDFTRLSEAKSRSQERERLRSGEPAPGDHQRVEREFGDNDRKAAPDAGTDVIDDEPDARADRTLDGSAGQEQRRAAEGDRAPVKDERSSAKTAPELGEEARGPGRDSSGDSNDVEENIDIGNTSESTPGQDIPSDGGATKNGDGNTVSEPSPGKSGRSGGSHGGGSSNGASSGSFPVLDGDDFAALSKFFQEIAAYWARHNAASAKSSGSQYQPPKFEPDPKSTYSKIVNRGAKVVRDQKITEQVQGFGLGLYEVQAIPPKGSDKKPDRLRTLDPQEIQKHSGYFAQKNMDGFDIYIRPAKVEMNGQDYAQPYVFVDDIDDEKIQQLEDAGLPLAIKNESSPGNYHGWIRVGDKPLKSEEMTRASKMVAKTIGGDVHAADWRHFGRLSGFTNQKPNRKKANGQAPFVQTTVQPGHKIAANGPALMEAARQQLQKEQQARQDQARQVREVSRQKAAQSALQGRNVLSDVSDARSRFHKGDDSSADFSAALSALGRGHDPDDILEALRASSPDLEKRHHDVDEYLRRTMEAAEEKHQRNQGRGRGMSI